MKTIPLYLGHEYDCDYLPGNRARIVYLPPQVPVDQFLYRHLVAQGFRRSGDLVYRPHCPACSACVPVRVPVAGFAPNRAQRRVMQRNADLRIVGKPDVFDEAHYRLYIRYLRSRHGDSPMAESSREDYLGFLGGGWGSTGFYEFLAGDELLAVAVVDHLDDGLSAMYTFYDPDRLARSLGTFAVLWQIGEATRRGLPWVYLGYWIGACRKMAYKGGFRPLEARLGSRWVGLDRGQDASG